MIKKYRKKPVVIEAMIFNGNNYDDVLDFVGEIMSKGFNFLDIRTLEGSITAIGGDYIIKGIAGEFYPCKPDIFKKTYEVVKE